MKITTLRQLIMEDIDSAFALNLYLFCNYDHIPKVITTAEFIKNFDSKGYYGPYRCVGINKEFLDLPLYLGD